MRFGAVMRSVKKAVHYGDERRAWNRDFQSYMQKIVTDPAYSGMPCTKDESGKIDWSIPSNRKEGSKNWNGNALRREWWRQAAKANGIAQTGNWISKTARRIHPTKEKPCQICGRVMKLDYLYPRVATLVRLNSNLPPDLQIDPQAILSIDEIIKVLFDASPDEASAALRMVFPEIGPATTQVGVGQAVHSLYVDKQSRFFSPGAMSNAPDRLDGFHSYNLCCRQKQDTGRDASNLANYTVDRRAYEQWCEGKWAEADYVMSQIGNGECAECHAMGPLTADHVGPLSLGFAHRPEFRVLCRTCNSGRNNRMTYGDVAHLIAEEKTGHLVISWHAKALWDALKNRVMNDDEALRLSRLLRISQHHYLLELAAVAHDGAPDALLQFLSLEQADIRYEGTVEKSTLKYSDLRVAERQATYSTSRAGRIARIALDALARYVGEPKRNIQLVVPTQFIAEQLRIGNVVAKILSKRDTNRDRLVELLDSEVADRDGEIAQLLPKLQRPYPELREALVAYMDAVARVLVKRFERGTHTRDGD